MQVTSAGSQGFEAPLFALATAVVVTVLLALARLSQRAVRPEGTDEGSSSPADGSDDVFPELVPPDGESVRTPSHGDGTPALHQSPHARSREQAGTAGTQVAPMSTGALLVNVAFTQGLFGAILVAAAWYTGVPGAALGITGDASSTGWPALVIGIGLGVALYATNEIGAAGADAMGVEYDERLRSLLAPESTLGWIVLLGLVLPIVAGVEEFIFRAAIVGATAVGFGVSPWPLAIVASLAFALGHGAQGRLGIVVTGGLGFVLASAFVLTGSFVVVFVAHYLVNALEFVVHELLDIEWIERIGASE